MGVLFSCNSVLKSSKLCNFDKIGERNIDDFKWMKFWVRYGFFNEYLKKIWE